MYLKHFSILLPCIYLYFRAFIVSVSYTHMAANVQQNIIFANFSLIFFNTAVNSHLYIQTESIHYQHFTFLTKNLQRTNISLHLSLCTFYIFIKLLF